jgi:hypothetical protein
VNMNPITTMPLQARSGFSYGSSEEIVGGIGFGQLAK